MFYDMFGNIRKNITKEKSLKRPIIGTLNPSSQVCYDINDNNKQIGACLRQVWFDKTNQPKTTELNPSTRMAGFSGNWWEEWFINQVKELGIYDDQQINATVPIKMVKGFIDISFMNPNLQGKLELGEVKTYNGSNYSVSQNIAGTAKIKPSPKLAHLLQAYRYLIIYKDEVAAINLFYIDRSCSDWYKNKQYRITLVESKGILYPKIETTWNNEYYTYVETKVSDKGIELAEDELIQYLKSGEVPPKGYIPIYSEDMIEVLFEKGQIPQYLYDRHTKDPTGYPLGDSQCLYCPYNKGTCASYD